MGSLVDPITGTPVNFGLPDTQAHHIFPTKYVDKMSGWNPKAGDKADLFLNLMQVSSETNTSYLNDNPRDQVLAATNDRNEDKVKAAYAVQGIGDEALNIMLKPDKSRSDYANFLKLRETYFERRLTEYGFTRSGELEVSDDTEIG